MNVRIEIDEESVTPKVIIYTKEVTKEIKDLANNLCQMQPFNLVGYKNDKLEILQLDEIIRIYSEQQKVFAQTDKSVFQLKYRLYEIEKKLFGHQFVRISNSEIVNFNRVKNLDMSLNGTICIIFKSGDKSFVSRRYITKIKKYLEMMR